jgi:DNA-binding CsgD family transcriptional regulator
MSCKREESTDSGRARQFAVAVRGENWTGRDTTLPSQLQQALVTVDGVQYAVVQVSNADFRPSVLTPAERAILPAILQGKSSREIAMDRGVAERTIVNQLASIYRKLEINSRGELVALASSFGDDSR